MKKVILNDKFRNYEFLYDEYIVKKKQLKEIAKECGVKSGCVIKFWLIKFGIKLRGKYRGIDLTGKRFGKLFIVKEFKYEENDPRWRIKRWICQCDCGNTKTLITERLTNGTSLCCGCTTHTKCGDISGEHFARIKNQAKIRNFEFNITIEQIWDLFLKQNKKCALSGVKIILERRTRKIKPNNTASLDRIDSNKGYTIDNVQWIHKDLNQMKMDMSESEFFNWINIIYKFKNSTNQHDNTQTNK